MYKHLDFPEKNMVKKSITPEQFIQKANLTDKERRVLKNSLKAIDIMYSFPFEDGEINVIQVEYGNATSSIYWYDSFVKSIVHSVPYDIFLIVKYSFTYRGYIFDTKVNKYDERRLVINDVKESPQIYLSNTDIEEEDWLEDMRYAIETSKTAQELHDKWYKLCPIRHGDSVLMLKNTPSSDSFILDIIRDRQNKFGDFLNKDKEEYYLDEDEELNTNSSFFGERFVIDSRENADAQEFILFCSTYSRSLYEELGVNDPDNPDEELDNIYDGMTIEDLDDDYLNYLTANEWIAVYIDACNEYAKEYFNGILSDRMVYEIKTVFWNSETENPDNVAECFDIEELKECIHSILREGALIKERERIDSIMRKYSLIKFYQD